MWSVTGEVETGRAEVEEKQKRVFHFFSAASSTAKRFGSKNKTRFFLLHPRSLSRFLTRRAAQQKSSRALTEVMQKQNSKRPRVF